LPQTVPVAVCQEDLHAGRLVQVCERWEPSPATIYAIYPNKRSLTTASHRFLEMMVARLPHLLGDYAGGTSL
jgi:DNA-binding transcriptional LysR family regulator